MTLEGDKWVPECVLHAAVPMGTRLEVTPSERAAKHFRRPSKQPAGQRGHQHRAICHHSRSGALRPPTRYRTHGRVVCATGEPRSSTRNAAMMTQMCTGWPSTFGAQHWRVSSRRANAAAWTCAAPLRPEINLECFAPVRATAGASTSTTRDWWTGYYASVTEAQFVSAVFGPAGESSPRGSPTTGDATRAFQLVCARRRRYDDA